MNPESAGNGEDEAAVEIAPILGLHGDDVARIARPEETFVAAPWTFPPVFLPGEQLHVPKYVHDFLHGHGRRAILEAAFRHAKEVSLR